jgi:hypothetical protein
VAEELERRWNRALERVGELESRIEREQSRREPLNLPPAEAFLSLASELEKIWNHPDTDVCLKKRFVRTLLAEVIVDVCPEAGEIELTLDWKGGIHTQLKVPRRRHGQNRRHTAHSIVEAMQLLTRICPDDQVAAWLNRNDLRTGQGHYWSQTAVASLRSKRNWSRYSAELRQAEGWMTLTEAALFWVCTTILRLAVEPNEIPGLHPLPKGSWIFQREDLQHSTAKQLVERVQRRRAGTKPDSQQLSLLYSVT